MRKIKTLADFENFRENFNSEEKVIFYRNDFIFEFDAFGQVDNFLHYLRSGKGKFKGLCRFIFFQKICEEEKAIPEKKAQAYIMGNYALKGKFQKDCKLRFVTGVYNWLEVSLKVLT